MTEHEALAVGAAKGAVLTGGKAQMGEDDLLSKGAGVDLAACRARIDEIDERIVELFQRRMRIARDIASYKRATGMAVLDASREKEKIERARSMADREFEEYIAPLFETLMELSRAYQDDVLASTTPSSRVAEDSVRSALSKTAAVAFRGDGIASCDTAAATFECPAMHACADRDGALGAPNIVLIGMPGAGKSTIGPILAEKLGRDFIDIDDLIPLSAGKGIAEIFAEDGEEAFREIETVVTSEACSGSGRVIACGGGVVTRRCNFEPVHRNGVVVLLRRPLHELVCDGRPLSAARGIEALARERKPLYESWADVAIDNTSAPIVVVDRLIELLRQSRGLDAAAFRR